MKLINGLYELTPEEIKLLESQDDAWPKEGDNYWFYYTSGDVGVASWDDDATDDNRLSIGNVFRTEAESLAHVEYLKAVQIIKKDAKGFVPDWSDGHSQKFFGYYNGHQNSLVTGFEWRCQYSTIYFATEQDIKDSFKNNKQAWLTYLGVKE